MCTQASTFCSGRSSKCLPPGFFFSLFSPFPVAAVLHSVAVVGSSKMLIRDLNYITNRERKEAGFHANVH